MASAQTLPLAIDKALRAGFFHTPDPGASGTLAPHNKGVAICEVVTAAAESRALPAASGYSVGTRILVCFKTDGGDLTITGSNQTVVLADAGDVVEFVVGLSGSTKGWKMIGDSRIRPAGARTLHIPIGNNWRNSDAIETNLAAADATGDLGLVTGTHGTTAPTLNVTIATPSGAEFRARDVGVQVPYDYKAGTNLTLSVAVTETVAATTALLDAKVFRTGAPSVDINSEAAKTAVGGGTITFILTGTNVNPGEFLDIELGLTLTDASATPNYSITAASLAYTAV